MNMRNVLQGVILATVLSIGTVAAPNATAAGATTAKSKPDTSIKFECVPAETPGNYWCCITFDDGTLVCTSGVLT